MFEWFREADTPAGPAFNDAIRTDSTKCQFVPTVSVEFSRNTQTWQCWHFYIALTLKIRWMSNLSLHGRYGIWNSGVHIQDPVMSVRVLRVFHNN